LRRTATGELVPYYDRGQIEDGALDGQHLEICWLRSAADALAVQIEGSARIRLEDGAMLRINYDAHNGYPFVPAGRVLVEHHLMARNEMSSQRTVEWMRENPEGAKEVRFTSASLSIGDQRCGKATKCCGRAETLRQPRRCFDFDPPLRFLPGDEARNMITLAVGPSNSDVPSRS
jgi:hypothetical protein